MALVQGALVNYTGNHVLLAYMLGLVILEPGACQPASMIYSSLMKHAGGQIPALGKLCQGARISCHVFLSNAESTVLAVLPLCSSFQGSFLPKSANTNPDLSGIPKERAGRTHRDFTGNT